ncbi:MAG: CRISPR-associated protein Cas4 [Lachnotalea sp.]
MDKQITGVMVYYYSVCKRKLWYFYHEVTMELHNENVQIGKIIDEETYMRDEKHINIDNVINIDFIRSRNVLHEIKKSNKIEEASILQVKYYLYYLKQRGVEVSAKIDYPLLKQCFEVTLNDEDVLEMETVLLEIERIVNQEYPPSLEKKSICKKCAYYDLCYI